MTKLIALAVPASIIDLAIRGTDSLFAYAFLTLITF